MNQIHIHYYKSPFGELVLGVHTDRLCLCDWRNRKGAASIERRLANTSTEFSKKTAPTCTGKRYVSSSTIFHVKERSLNCRSLLQEHLSEKSVDELTQTPYGETVSYRETC